MTTTQANPFMQAIKTFESDKNLILQPVLEAAASAAQVLLERMQIDTITAVKSRLGDASTITDCEFYEMFAALDVLSEEVGMDQTLLFHWRAFERAPDPTKQRQVLIDILAWVEKYSITTGEQIIAQEVEDLGWSGVYLDMPEHMKD